MTRFRAVYVVFPIVMFLALLAFPVVVHLRQEAAYQDVYREEIAVGAGVQEVDGKNIYRWGLKRGKNGSLPEVGKAEVNALERHGGCYLGNPQEKVIYLTFDEGYENGYTAPILDVLKAEQVPAIFFITGDYFARNQELIQRMLEEGHEIGNHSQHHYSFPEISDAQVEAELMDLDRLVNETFQVKMRLMRPPKGEYNDASLAVTERLSYTCVMWSFAYQDWLVDQQKGADYAFRMVTENLHPGAILLLHAVSRDNADALTRIIQYAKAEGYRFGSADELLQSRSVG